MGTRVPIMLPLFVDGSLGMFLLRCTAFHFRRITLKGISTGDWIKELIIMEDDPVQAYERRMRKFNFVVIVASLIALVILIILSWPFLQ